MTETTPVQDTRPDTNLTKPQADDLLAKIERQQRESIERAAQISRAWESTEARRLHDFIRADGNVDYREFVSHVGGILAAVAMVDENGDPDHEQIIPKVDEIFAKYATREFTGGMTMTSKPQNRPYKPRPAATDAPR
ncbi:hypothetical protein ACFVWP_46960 [Streptomyces sp. NPDC058175]|uniref:hypothetical protein n=1 Tax=Streptomyces sp. NPDC058175 TaxID=3346367 RepID=UPI0036E3C79D